MNFKIIIMKNSILFSCILLFGACKAQNIKKVHEDVSVINNTIVDTNNNTSITIKIKCYDYLTELIRSSNFPFGNIEKSKVNTLIDDDNGKIIRAKLFFDTDGTGTIGWAEYDIKQKKLFNTSADLDTPKELEFSNKYAMKFDSCLGSNKKFDNKITSNSLSEFYQQLKLILLPNKYSFDFITNENDFIQVPNELYSLFEFKNMANFKMAKLPSIGKVNPILLIVYNEQGQSKWYLISLDSSYTILDKLKLYDSMEISGATISTTYEITNTYTIKIKTSQITDFKNKVNEKILSIKTYKLNLDGKIILL